MEAPGSGAFGGTNCTQHVTCRQMHYWHCDHCASVHDVPLHNETTLTPSRDTPGDSTPWQWSPRTELLQRVVSARGQGQDVNRNPIQGDPSHPRRVMYRHSTLIKPALRCQTSMSVPIYSFCQLFLSNSVRMTHSSRFLMSSATESSKLDLGTSRHCTARLHAETHRMHLLGHVL